MAIKYRYLAGFLAVSLLVATFLVYRHHRNEHIESLYRTVLFGGTREAESAETELGNSAVPSARERLMRVALSRHIFTDHRQEFAVQVLAKSHDPEVMVQLASLLQPHRSLALRHAVATALQENPCAPACVDLILRYLYRAWAGEPNGEDWGMEIAAVKESIEKEQHEVLSELQAVLVRNKGGTLMVLRDVYGLGDVRPSPFALYIVQTLNLQDACPWLEHSRREAFNSNVEEKIGKTMLALHCSETSSTPEKE